MGSERRQVVRHTMRTPLRFRAINLASDKSEHFTEVMNISRGGFFLCVLGATASRHADRLHAANARRKSPAAARRRRIVWRASCMCGMNLTGMAESVLVPRSRSITRPEA